MRDFLRLVLGGACGLLVLAAAGNAVGQEDGSGTTNRDMALAFARGLWLEPGLDAATEERVLAILAAARDPRRVDPRNAGFARDVERLCTHPSWVLRRRGARLARWYGPHHAATVVLDTFALHRDPAWPVRAAAWRAVRGVVARRLRPWTEVAEDESLPAVRAAWRDTLSVAGSERPLRFSRESVERDLRSPDPALREATGRFLLRHGGRLRIGGLDDPGLPRSLRRLLAGSLLGSPRDPETLRRDLESAPHSGPFAAYLGFVHDPQRPSRLRSFLVHLREHERVLGDDLLRWGYRVCARDLVASLASETERLRFCGVSAPLAAVLAASPVTARPWTEEAFLFRLLLTRSRRSLAALALSELRVRALGTDARGRRAAWSAEFLVRLRTHLIADAPLAERAGILDVLWRGGEDFEPARLWRLAQERSDPMRRAAFRALCDRPDIEAESLFEIVLPWLDRGPGAAALEDLRRVRPDFDPEVALAREIAEGRGTPGIEAALLASSSVAGLSRARLAVQGRIKRALDARLVDLGDEAAGTRALALILEKGEAATPRDVLGLEGLNRKGLSTLLEFDDARLGEEPRLLRLALIWHRRDGGRTGLQDFAGRALAHWSGEVALDETSRRALLEALAEGLEPAERIALGPEIVEAARRRPRTGRELWNLLANLPANVVDSRRLATLGGPSEIDEGSLRRRVLALSAQWGDQGAVNELLRQTWTAFDEASPAIAYEKFVADLAVTRGNLRARLLIRAEERLWVEGRRRGRSAPDERRRVGAWLRALVCAEGATFDLMADTRHGDRATARADLLSPRRLAAWLDADTEASLARPDRPMTVSLDVAVENLPTGLLTPALARTLGLRMSRRGLRPVSPGPSAVLPPAVAGIWTFLPGDTDAVGGRLQRRRRELSGPARYFRYRLWGGGNAGPEGFPHPLTRVLTTKDPGEQGRRWPRDPVCAGREPDSDQAFAGGQGASARERHASAMKLAQSSP